MKQITDIADVHSILLDLAKEFDRICRVHNIPYYMIGGTMLGAVRHKGFIPWDDDMDFAVQREYYEKLISLLKRYLPPYYKVISMENCKSLPMDIVKISDVRTHIEELYREGFNEDVGVNIDIFPLDKFEQRGGVSKKIGRTVKIAKYVQTSPKSMALKNKIIAYILKIIFFWTRRYTFVRYINYLLPHKGNYIGNIYGAYGDRETVHEEVFGSPREYIFENIKLYGVTNADTYLKSLYGDYMQLPPADKRHIHIDNVYWK